MAEELEGAAAVAGSSFDTGRPEGDEGCVIAVDGEDEGYDGGESEDGEGEQSGQEGVGCDKFHVGHVGVVD